MKEVPAYMGCDGSVDDSAADRKGTVFDRISSGKKLNSIPSDSGLLHTSNPRKHLTFKEAPNNSVIQHYGAYIVMGTDRMGHLGSGAGASGFCNSDSVDIVVGRGANLNTAPSIKGDSPSGPANGFIVGPLPVSDAARVYITSKSNVDKDFGIAETSRDPHAGSNKHMLSAVVAKADNVRMIARNNIKIVTGRNQGYTGGKEKNSLGGVSPQAGTISLIGGNYTESSVKLMGLFSDKGPVSSVSYLQPAIKGDNLVECLKACFTYIDMVNAVVMNQIWTDMAFGGAALADPFTPPTQRLNYAAAMLDKVPWGLEFGYVMRSWAETQRRKYLEYGGDHHIRSANVYLT